MTQALIDRRLGLITAVVPHARHPAMPWAWIGYGAHVSRTAAFASWTADRYGFGASIGDADAARRAAIGEAVERYCGNAVPDMLEMASYDDLIKCGRRAVDPSTFALYSEAQYATPGFPFVPLRRDLTVAWTIGRDLHTNDEVYVPAALVYLDYFHGSRRTEPPTNSLNYAGIAAGETVEHAERFALEELFERDATTIWWASGIPAAIVEDGARIIDQLDDPWLHDRHVRILAIPSAFDLPVLAAFIEDRRRGVVAFGSACRANATLAATKALVEALGLYELTLKLTEPDSDVWRAMDLGVLASHVYKPFRPDRSYRDAFRPDFRDLVDLPAVAQLFLDPRMQGEPLDRLRETDGPKVRLDDLASADGPDDPLGERARNDYLDRLAAAGLRAISVDLTTPDVRLAGLRVVRVLVPGLYGNAPAAFPLLGGTRLYHTPVERGWIDTVRREEDIPRVPIPLA